MRFFCCSTCQHTWQLGGDFQEIQHIINMLDSEKEVYPCITPHCNGRLMKVPGHPFEYTAKEIPVRAFYRAVHGFGVGEGETASVERFTELLRTKQIVEVHATPVGQPERVILNQLVLEDGARLHFDSSSRGACCYYIEESGPSCVEVVDDELSTDATSEVSHSHREEVGRASKDFSELGDETRSVTDSASTFEQSSSGSMSSVSKTSNVQVSSSPRNRGANTN